MSFYSPWLKRRPRSRAESKTPRKLQLELLEDRRLPTTGLGQISGLTDTPQELFVTGLYYDILYRVPKPSDVASWVNVLNAGTTPTAIALAFTGSTESHDNFILDNYNNYLGRDATAGDIGAWASAMQGGMSEEAVSATFLSCNEYYLKQGGNNTAWLTALYQDVLGRTPDSSGLASWNQALQNGTSRNSVASAIINSTEAEGMLVQAVYQRLLGRNADPAGLSQWVSLLGTGMTAGQFTAQIAGSGEYWNGQTTALLPLSKTSSTQSLFHFDFGTNTSPIAQGYTRVPLVNFSSTNGYGWSSVLNLGYRNRNYSNALTRDFHWGQDGTFLVNLANKPYLVTVSLGDSGASHTNMAIWINGVQQASGINTVAGQFVSVALPVQITNGQLGLRIASTGGTRPTFALDGVDISADTPPVPNAGSAQTGNEGSPVTFSASETGGIAPFTYSWNFGDGTTGSGSLTPTHTYVDNGVYTAVLTVTDAFGLTGTASTTATINNVAPANISLTPSANPINVGDTITLSGSFTDPGTNDTHQVTVDWADGSAQTTVNLAAGVLTFSGLSHQYTTGSASQPSGSYQISVTVTDKDGAQGTGTTPIQVNTSGPASIVLTPSATSINEGSSITLGGSFTEPGSVDTHQVTIDWGDGSTSSVINLAAGTFSFSGAAHQYLDNPTGQASGSYKVTVTVTDQHSGQGSASTSVQVNNVAPANIVVTPSATSINENGTLTLSGSFTDSGTLDTHQVTVVWADGSPNTVISLAAGTLTFSGISHTYADNPAGQPNGSFKLTVTVADKDGARNTASTSVQVNNVAPAVSAGGPYSAAPNTSINFTSTVTDPSPVDTAAGFTYSWNFGDSATSTLASPSHAYTSAGTYTVSLKVTDKDGGATTVTTSVTVTQTTGTTYYVSPSGSDSSPGTVTQPFATIAKGTSALHAGDTLYLRAGTYAENLVDKLPSGTSSAPITVAAYPGESVTLRPGTGNFVLRVQGAVSYVTINGLVLDGTGTASANVYIVALSSGTPSHIRISNSEIENAGTQGLLVECLPGYPTPDYNQFVKDRIHDNGTTDFNHGLYIQSNYNLIDGCNVYRNAGWGMQIFMQTGVNGVNAGHNIVRNSMFHDNARVGGRGVGIGVYVGDGNLVYNNLVWNNQTGISVDYGATNSGIFNNDILSSIDVGIRIGYNAGASNTTVQNNIIYQNTNGDIKDYGTGTVANHNLLNTTNPLFVDAANANFHLQAGSPAIDAGITVAVVTTDFDGIARPQGSAYDIGAFEYH